MIQINLITTKNDNPAELLANLERIARELGYKEKPDMAPSIGRSIVIGNMLADIARGKLTVSR